MGGFPQLRDVDPDNPWKNDPRGFSVKFTPTIYDTDADKRLKDSPEKKAYVEKYLKKHPAYGRTQAGFVEMAPPVKGAGVKGVSAAELDELKQKAALYDTLVAGGADGHPEGSNAPEAEKETTGGSKR